MRPLHRLSKTDVLTSPPGRYPDGGGLWLQVTPARRRSPDSDDLPKPSRSWIFRYKRGSRVNWMGLGSVAVVPLTDARRRAQDARRQLLDGIDPIEAREAKTANRHEADHAPTFAALATQYHTSGKFSGNSEKHVSQWLRTLETYAFPHFGDLPVSMVDIHLVRKALDPIWTVRTETANRVRQRIEKVLEWAELHHYRSKGDNPARWDGNLEHIYLPKSKIAPVKHHPALPYLLLQSLMADLGRRSGYAALALRFLILTGARTGEVQHAPIGEFDLKERAWTIPAGRMKGRREHRVPLSDPALNIAAEMIDLHSSLDMPKSQFIFPGRKLGSPLNDKALLELLQSIHPQYDVHGLRATFRTWVEEETNYPHEVKEAALAHTIRNKVEKAYQRSDLFEKRRQLMIDWAKFCVGG